MNFLCLIGYHRGIVKDGAFRCSHCSHADYYRKCKTCVNQVPRMLPAICVSCKRQEIDNPDNLFPEWRRRSSNANHDTKKDKV